MKQLQLPLLYIYINWSVPSFKGNSSDISKCVTNYDGNSGFNRISSSKGQWSDVFDTLFESWDKWAGVKVKDFFGEDVSLIVDISNFHTILEWFHVEFLKKGCFWSFNFLSFGANSEFFGDFNLTLDDFGGDVEGVEEVDLGWIKTSGSCWASKIDGWDNSNSCFSWNFVGFNFSSEFMDIGITEDKGNFLLKEWGQDG